MNIIALLQQQITDIDNDLIKLQELGCETLVPVYRSRKQQLESILCEVLNDEKIVL